MNKIFYPSDSGMYSVGSMGKRSVNSEFQSSAIALSSFYSGFMARMVLTTAFMVPVAFVDIADA